MGARDLFDATEFAEAVDEQEAKEGPALPGEVTAVTRVLPDPEWEDLTRVHSRV